MRKLLDILGRPVAVEMRQLLAYFFVLVAVSVCYNSVISNTLINAVLWSLAQAPVYFAVSYALAASGYFLKRISKWLGVLVYLVFALYVLLAIVECYLCVFMKTGIVPMIFTFLFQTSPVESQGFMTAFILTKGFLIYVCSLVGFAVVSWLAITFVARRWRSAKWLGTGAVASVLYTVVIFGISALCGCRMATYPGTSVSRSVVSFVQYCKTMNAEKNICLDSKLPVLGYNYPDVVVVIGEAFTKYHSSLYGYEKETNPLLQRYVDQGNMYLFDDVISPYNKTHLVMKELLSMHSYDSKMDWEEYPLWTKIFMDAGYHVSFVSNQVPASQSDSYFQPYFYLYPRVQDNCFSYRNTETYRYDEELLQELDIIDSLVIDVPELTILQLNGQHIYASNNFPHDRFTHFMPEDYLSHKLNPGERELQELADYDNATLYNDYVVSQIIERYKDREVVVVYLSDHGEEVHDYRLYLGRTQEAVPPRDVIRYQYEIPFMIYLTDSYKAAHPGLAERIEASVHKRFMSDDFAHMMLGICSIGTQWYEPERDILDDRYNEDRERIFGY